MREGMRSTPLAAFLFLTPCSNLYNVSDNGEVLCLLLLLLLCHVCVLFICIIMLCVYFVHSLFRRTF